MACSSQVVKKSAESYHEENKATVDEMMKCTKALLTQNPIRGQDVATAAQVQNMTRGPLNFVARKDWLGRSLVPYPQVIDSLGEFMHASTDGTVGQSNIGAVVYGQESGLCWLLAWSVTPSQNNVTNKVYVEGGTLANLSNWDLVRFRLDTSSTMSYDYDVTTGFEMFAAITPRGNMAQLAAIYAQT